MYEIEINKEAQTFIYNLLNETDAARNYASWKMLWRVSEALRARTNELLKELIES